VARRIASAGSSQPQVIPHRNVDAMADTPSGLNSRRQVFPAYRKPTLVSAPDRSYELGCVLSRPSNGHEVAELAGARCDCAAYRPVPAFPLSTAPRIGSWTFTFVLLGGLGCGIEWVPVISAGLSRPACAGVGASALRVTLWSLPCAGARVACWWFAVRPASGSQRCWRI